MVDSAEGAEGAVAFPAAEVGPGVGVVGEVVVGGGGGGGHFCGLVGFFFWFVFVSSRLSCSFWCLEEFRYSSSSSFSSFSLQRYSCPHMQHYQSR